MTFNIHHDYHNSDYHNRDYHNRDYHNSDYHNSDYHNFNFHNAEGITLKKTEEVDDGKKVIKDGCEASRLLIKLFNLSSTC